MEAVLDRALERLLEGAGLPSDKEMGAIAEQLAYDTMEEAPKLLYSKIKTMGLKHIRAERKYRSAFLKDHIKRWRHAIDLLEVLSSYCLELGHSFYQKWRSDPSKIGEHMFAALIFLHSRACLVTQEIVALLREGFADGALARWRTLHEIAVVSQFIAKHGDETAERYLMHSAVVQYKGMRNYQDHCHILGQQPFSEEELHQAAIEYRKIKTLYGSRFTTYWGWANKALGRHATALSDLVQDVKVEHLDPYVSWATKGVHGNFQDPLALLGMSEAREPMFLVGASDSGLSDPAHCTAISLCQIMSSFLFTETRMDHVIFVKVALMLRDEIGEAFLACEADAETDTETTGGDSP